MAAPVLTYEPVSDVPLGGAMLVIGFPTPGFVAQVATRYLVTQQRLPLVGTFRSTALPPAVALEEGEPLPPFRLHAGPQVCGLDSQCSQLAVLLGDELFPDETHRPHAASLLDWAESAGVGCVIALEGMPHREPGADQPRISGAASSARARRELASHDVPLLGDVLVRGTTAALLDEARGRKLDVVALFVEAHNAFRDAQAAAALVEAVDRFLLHIPIDATPLRAQAEALTRQLRAAVERTRQTGSMMYG